MKQAAAITVMVTMDTMGRRRVLIADVRMEGFIYKQIWKLDSAGGS